MLIHSKESDQNQNQKLNIKKGVILTMRTRVKLKYIVNVLETFGSRLMNLISPNMTQSVTSLDMWLIVKKA